MFFQKPGEQSNRIALIIKHVGGNLASRWTDFLTTDGEKSWRNRECQFILEPDDTRAGLFALWERGWSAVIQSLGSLQETELLKKVRIRGEDHTVLQAIHRSLSHTSYQVGQIVYLCRLLTKDSWQWITIPPVESEQARSRGGSYLK